MKDCFDCCNYRAGYCLRRGIWAAYDRGVSGECGPAGKFYDRPPITRVAPGKTPPSDKPARLVRRS